jgi:two-component system, cell cycle response regulator
MDRQPLKVLLIEDNPGDVRLIREMLVEVDEARFAVMVADSLQAGVDCLEKEGAAAVLLDLNLPDSVGLDTLNRLLSYAPDSTVVVLTGLDDHELGVQAVKAGAQDYLIKGQVNRGFLARAILYAMERQQMRAMLNNLCLEDELTAFYNRRGFMTLAEQQWTLSQRTHQHFLLFSADLDGMKQINDTYGHPEGDRALQKTASIIQNTFRRSDIKARLGGDEFAVLMIDGDPDSASQVMKRWQRYLDEENRAENCPYLLSLSWGVAHYDPEKPALLENLLAQADQALYAEKRRKGPYDINKKTGKRLSEAG